MGVKGLLPRSDAMHRVNQSTPQTKYSLTAIDLCIADDDFRVALSYSGMLSKQISIITVRGITAIVCYCTTAPDSRTVGSGRAYQLYSCRLYMKLDQALETVLYPYWKHI